jgi:hypothetical protein
VTAYFARGKHNPFDAYMAGMCWWVSPRQILVLDEMFKRHIPRAGVEADAFEDMKSQILHEAEIKRKRFSVS